MSYQLPDIKEFVQLDIPKQKAVLAHLFEPCETLNELILRSVLASKPSFTGYTSLIESVRTELLKLLSSDSEDPRISKIIAAHPRLGAQKKNLSSHSQAEQESLKEAAEEEKVKLQHLNQLYEGTFPGLRYVVFVNGRSRDVIMENMEFRIKRADITAERTEAFNVSMVMISTMSEASNIFFVGHV